MVANLDLRYAIENRRLLLAKPNKPANPFPSEQPRTRYQRPAYEPGSLKQCRRRFCRVYAAYDIGVDFYSDSRLVIRSGRRDLDCRMKPAR